MDDFMNQAVTVSVITYNSSKFVLETLESIKAQTYKNLILRICDDCSTDNTVAICRAWIERNKDRFLETDIIVPEHNTGVSANCNRAWDACATKYHKSIAGDDVLLANCIEDNMNYVYSHPDAGFVFSKMTPFGEKRLTKEMLDDVFLEFFSLNVEGMLDTVLNRKGCPPAPSCFTNIEEIRRVGLRHDERIPMMEDIPKWINALRLGVKFERLDKDTVLYRVHDASLSTACYLTNPKFERSLMLFWFYYHFVPKYDADRDLAIDSSVDKMMSYYIKYYNEVKVVRMSKRFKLMTSILKPFDKMREFVRRLAN